MDIWDTMKIMVRRWYVVLPVGVVCVIATVSFSSGVDSEYLASGVAFVKGPEVQEVVVEGEPELEARNPYLGTGGTDTFARILLESVSSTDTRTSFSQRGLPPTFDLSLDRSEAIIDVEVRASSPELAVESVSELLALLKQVAEDRQLAVEGLDERGLITVEVLSQSGAGIDNAAPRRIFGVLAAVSLIVVVGSAFLVEGVVGHLRGDRPSWYAAPEQVTGNSPPPLAAAVAVGDDEPRYAPPSRLPSRDIHALEDTQLSGESGASEDEGKSREPGGRWRRPAPLSQ